MGMYVGNVVGIPYPWGNGNVGDSGIVLPRLLEEDCKLLWSKVASSSVQLSKM